MTATEQLIAKQVSDVFPASVDDLPLGDAARRGLIAPLRCLRVPPAAAISSVPIVGGDYEQDALARSSTTSSSTRPPRASTGIASTTPRDRVRGRRRPRITSPASSAPRASRPRPSAAALRRSGLPRPWRHTSGARSTSSSTRSFLAEGWNSPRATVCMHLAPTASRRVYQQRIGRVMRMHPRKEAGVVVDFVDAAATHNERTITLHSLLDSDFYRPGARDARPRRRIQRRARRKLSPAPWLVPVTPNPRRMVVITRSGSASIPASSPTTSSSSGRASQAARSASTSGSSSRRSSPRSASAADS